ncbi:uncharacterized protein FIBRA_02753 [Fibroporia radiculosa]|uniref:CDC20/Fizzy WD40 domain-containing protein n=1 Tax=Fibroporia radiculosa TaxID=599839 RepID=J4G2M1_9APHY|nr:uncharacterized protein FIBRA_02753 [Fibroporia radiculosa]CCM00713.1 predicted protein [Fibroporia radiculosa]
MASLFLDLSLSLLPSTTAWIIVYDIELDCLLSLSLLASSELTKYFVDIFLPLAVARQRLPPEPRTGLEGRTQQTPPTMDASDQNLPIESCVTPRRKRTWAPGSVTNAYSAKRRRTSMVSIDFGREIASVDDLPGTSQATVADRFISAPQEVSMPLNITPRTNRIARQFGLITDRVLNFADRSGGGPSSGNPLGEHRFQIQKLFSAPRTISPTSAAANLGTRKQFVLALDGPGMPESVFAFPLAWSRRNAIAVACGRDYYYEDLDTRAITHLGALPKRGHGRLASIQWAVDAPHILAGGSSTGLVQLWDANAKALTREWQCRDWDAVGGMDWRGDVFAVGEGDGTVEMFDKREAKAIGVLATHKCKVHGVRWSTDGDYLATSDQHGVVQVWDARAGKSLSSMGRSGCKKKHNGAPVKALAWCPWKPDLLATGSSYPDGRIRIWSVNEAESTSPRHSLALNTSVTSLIWSPHCKELLSTHGTSWQARSTSTPNLSSGPIGRRTRSSVLRAGAVPIKSEYTNSLAVHSYPTLTRVVCVPAHAGSVSHSCLSPDGTMVFTICPAEEAMKMWKVWGAPRRIERRESVFDKCGIR